jgi:hypothetical protein
MATPNAGDRHVRADIGAFVTPGATWSGSVGTGGSGPRGTYAWSSPTAVRPLVRIPAPQEHDGADGRRDQLYHREAAAAPSNIARQQRQPRDGGMGANEEIRKYTLPGSTMRPIPLEAPSGQEQRWPRHRPNLDGGCAQESLYGLDSRKPHRQLGVDDIVDEQGTAQ